MIAQTAWLCCGLCLLGSVSMGEDAADEPVVAPVPLDDDLAGVAIPSDAVRRGGLGNFRPGDTFGESYEYFVGEQLVGERWYYNKNGRIAQEWIYRDGELHGYHRQWWPNGQLFAMRPFRHGVRDGTFRFWNDKGKLLGESKIENGTGTLREFQNFQFGSHDADIPYVDNKIEGVRVERYGKCTENLGTDRGESRTRYVAGKMQGWALTYCGSHLVSSSWFKEGKYHGVRRKTDLTGGPLKGFPKYYINGKEVNEKVYLKAAKTDEELQKSLAPPKGQEGPEA